MILSSDFKFYAPPPIDKDAVLKYALCKEPDENVYKLLEECINESNRCLVYRVAYIRSTFEIDGDIIDLGFTQITSKMLIKVLSDCDSYIVFAATVGMGIDHLIKKYSRTAPSKALMLQALGTERVESLCDLFVKDIKKELKIKTSRRVSAGYGDLPLSIQSDIIRLLDCPRKMGLVLNDSLLMSPTKSVTAFMGIKK